MREIVRISLLLCIAAVLLAGCAGMGPATVAQDRFDYAASTEPAAAQVQSSEPQPPETHYQAARAALMGATWPKPTSR